jgi:hypothetical protein
MSPSVEGFFMQNTVIDVNDQTIKEPLSVLISRIAKFSLGTLDSLQYGTEDMYRVIRLFFGNVTTVFSTVFSYDPLVVVVDFNIPLI